MIQPACAAGCALLWMCYGLMRRDRDWPIVIANLPGVLLAGTTVVTAFT
ncbi:hypothetical protein [Sphingomonas gellani]|nr:hypothetical protein [Sphingomonas gellani]